MIFKYCIDSNPQPPRAQATRSSCKTCCSDENKFLFYNLQKNHSLPSSKTLWFIFEVCRANLDNNLVYYNMQGAPLKMVSKASIIVFLKSFSLEGLIFARLCPFFYYILYHVLLIIVMLMLEVFPLVNIYVNIARKYL